MASQTERQHSHFHVIAQAYEVGRVLSFATVSIWRKHG